MDTFGARLQSEREGRGLSIQEAAEILRVDQNVLEALERNDFDALPDEATMMDCLHAYAGCLQVDADLMIEDYVAERNNRPQRLRDEVVEQVAETEPVAAEVRPRPRVSPWVVALVGFAIALFGTLGVWWTLSRDAVEPMPEVSVAAVPVEPEVLPSNPPAEVATAVVEPPAAHPAPTTPQPSEPSKPAVTPDASVPFVSSPLTITEFGVGTAVEDRRLVGRGNRFAEGTKVAFWIRVQGGGDPSDRIDHVWLREGVEVTRVSLRIGGSNWRTYSTKTLFEGSAGDWSVEARDDANRVLARSEFVCVR